MKTTSILVAVASLAFAANAATWWVDDDNYGNGGTGTEANPFGTIQDALDNPGFTAGDTVNVKAGVYDKGGRKERSADVKSRVVITNKVFLTAVEGRDKTFIVGEPDPNGNQYGLGDNATRCICVNAPGIRGSRIMGFTICNGRTATGASANKCYAAGVFDVEGQKGYDIVDCVISNCVAYIGGATRYGRLYRSFVTDCYAESRVSGTHGTAVHSSIIAYCKEVGDGVMGGAAAVNCTFFANSGPIGGTAYNCIFAGTGTEPSSASSIHTADGYHQLFAPAFGDYRPIPGSAALTRGDAGNLGQATLHTYSLGKGNLTDYNGNTYPSSGTIAAGAIQDESPVPAGGALQFGTTGVGFDIDGHFVHNGDYLFAEAYPTQYHVKAVVPDGQYMFGYDRTADNGGIFYPQMDDKVWLMPPADAARVSTNTAIFATRAFWVSPSGNDGNAGTEDAPFKTLQKAVDSCPNTTYSVVFAGEGDYNEGGKMHNASTHPLTNRVYFASNKYVFLRGAGAGRSFITGSVDPVTGGTGTGVIRPVASMSSKSAVQGFTLRGAGAYNDSDNPEFMTISAFVGNDAGTHLLDSIVTECSGSAAIVYRCTVTRCRIVGNTTMRNIVNVPKIISSVVADNVMAGTGGVFGYFGANCACYSSTIKGVLENAVAGASGANYVRMAASIFHTANYLNSGLIDGCLFWNFKSYPSGATTGDPRFTALNDGDFRVIASSPAYTCGLTPTVSNYGADWWKYAMGDIDGNPLVFTDGKPLAGACHTPGLSEWYVDAVNGNDANTGNAADDAKQSLSAVLGKVLPPGATVHVAAGTYAASEPMYVGNSTNCGSRAVVSAGVTLEGAGADVTTISGAAAPNGDDSGLGDGAIRCVYLGRGATVRGFTLTGGRTCKQYDGDSVSKENVNNVGAGVYGESAVDCTVEDCIITGCNGWRAGGVAFSTIRRCRMFNCSGSDTSGQGSGAYKCKLYNTIVDRCGEKAVMYPSDLENCTIGADNYGSESVYMTDQFPCRIVNTLALGNVYLYNANSPATNSLFAGRNVAAAAADYWLGPNSVQTNAAALAVDANYMPVIGSNVGIDAANASLYTDGDKDAFGGQRVYNNALDIGAVEADWRAKYAADLGGRYGFSVTAASPEVEETVGGKVRLVSDTTLDAAWLNGARARKCSFTFSLDADSVLVVTLDGVSTTYDTAGTHEFTFRSTAGSENVVSFACTAGAVELLSADRLIGTAFTFR